MSVQFNDRRKPMKTSLAVLVMVSLMLTACASAPKTTTQASTQEITGSNERAGPGAETAIASKPGVVSGDLAAQLEAIQQKSVYFDFDEFVIKPEYHGIIEQLADFMKTHENTTVTLEGNADERGSGEYNLSLGSKRAFAVLKSLEVMGIPGSRIESVSLGEEKPRLTCHEERCWKENRRTDLIIKQGP
jgi:peptidoglycan-associated lipoprotein